MLPWSADGDVRDGRRTEMKKCRGCQSGLPIIAPFEAARKRAQAIYRNCGPILGKCKLPGVRP